MSHDPVRLCWHCALIMLKVQSNQHVASSAPLFLEAQHLRTPGLPQTCLHVPDADMCVVLCALPCSTTVEEGGETVFPSAERKVSGAARMQMVARVCCQS